MQSQLDPQLSTEREWRFGYTKLGEIRKGASPSLALAPVGLPRKPWVGTETPCDDEDKLLFAACATITIGDGKRASFWDSRSKGADLKILHWVFLSFRGKKRELFTTL
jgi:hypothetical protein